MAENSKIEWTHHTANLWHGCTKVHAGCDHCYAETLSHRWNRDIWGNDKPRLEIKSVWNDLKRYQQLAVAAGEIHRVFVGSMMDIFEKPMPFIDSKGTLSIDASDGSPIATDYIRDRFFEEIVPASPNLMFLLLTKRPSNIVKYVPTSWLTNPPKNVMYGTSPCDQETANTLIRQLMKVPGKRFLSIEPLLGPIDITNKGINNGYSVPTRWTDGKGIEWTDPSDNFIGVDWVITGGESGHGARPINPKWVRSLRDQCKYAGIPFFFKQWGEYLNDKRVGKKAAGRELDGIIHNDFPHQIISNV